MCSLTGMIYVSGKASEPFDLSLVFSLNRKKATKPR